MAMLDSSVKLTARPGDMFLEDVDHLSDAGFNDRTILAINQILAYFAYVHRVADGLRVELEDFWEKK